MRRSLFGVFRRHRKLTVASGAFALMAGPFMPWFAAEENLCGWACFGPSFSGANQSMNELSGWALSPVLSSVLLVAGVATLVVLVVERWAVTAAGVTTAAALALIIYVAFGAGVDYAVGKHFISRVGPSAWTLIPVLGGLLPLADLISARRDHRLRISGRPQQGAPQPPRGPAPT